MLSGLVLLVIALVCVWAGGYAFLLLTAVACLLLAREWVTLCGYAAMDPPGCWMPAVVVAAALCGGLGAAGMGLLFVLAGTVAAAILLPRKGPSFRYRHGPSLPYRHGPARPGHLAGHDGSADGPVEPGHDGEQTPGHGEEQTPGHDGAHTPGHDEEQRPGQAQGRSWPARVGFNPAFGVPYIGLAAVALPWLRADPLAGLPNTLFVLSIVWASDIGAYLAGRLVGGPKLAPAISPGKTWSGAVGGLVSAALAGLAMAACLSSGISSSHVIGLAIGLGIISQAGDLLESALKRHFGVKDSGRIIPGHGGLLDRLDALLAVAPVAALVAFTVGRGVVLWR